MPDLLVRDLSDATLAVLKKRAQQNRRSMQREALAILEDAAESVERRQRMVLLADQLRSNVALEFPRQSDSVELVREDRER